MNSTDLSNIKLITSVEHNKKKVKITCKNKEEGKVVSESISNNTKLLMAESDYDFQKGVSYKDFTYKFGSKEEAKFFKDKIVEYKNMDSSSDSSSSSSLSGSSSSSFVQQSTMSDSGGANTTMLLIVAAVIAVAAIGLFVWKKRG